MVHWTVVLVSVLVPMLIEGASQLSSSVVSRIKRQAPPVGSGCQMADIVFVLDSSGSIGVTHWPQTLSFVNEVTYYTIIVTY